MDLISNSQRGVAVAISVYQAYLLYKQAKGYYDFCHTGFHVGYSVYTFVSRKGEVKLLTRKELHEVGKEWIVVENPKEIE